ncbi:MAG TPA: hypothetical protein VJ813_07260 [Vicinamibacterales bacterium]|nr:hypothetical protein [Vicinamibacterales bacterium]
MTTIRLLTACVLTLAAVPAYGQSAARAQPARGFVTFNAAAQGAAADLTDRVFFESNAETGTIETRYPGRTGLLIDVGGGWRVWRRLGVGVAVSRTTSSGTAAVTAEMPHPFFDNRDRHIEGEATSVSRTQTATHAELYYELPSRGRWRMRLFAGPSYFNLEQDVVTAVSADETYPYDTAGFGSATTGRAKGSGLGINGGADVAWMFSRRIGAGALIRYAHASLDLTAPGSRNVSSDGGGLQGGGGIRILF